MKRLNKTFRPGWRAVKKPKKEPLAQALVNRSLAPTLERARPLIMTGNVIVDDHMIDKPGTLVSPTARIRLKTAPSAYVSRGGEKLEKPLGDFALQVRDKTILDVGASTGGFSDCLLQHGARLVYAVDVGYGQLAWKLQTDPRVIALERTNIRSLSADDFDPKPDCAVIDASFISLQKIIGHVAGLLVPGSIIIGLIKPQFEAKKGSVDKGGIVRDPALYRDVIAGVTKTALALSLQVVGITESPIQGQKGNREFFIVCRKP
ncbi:MAG: TlyA family RNA methyltransferase [Deltaproteobacteria bacterium]|nr:TlyA family RNA methyltransferase [Deltaproteobacteria bacterium]